MNITPEAEKIISKHYPESETDVNTLSGHCNEAIEWALTNPSLLKAQGLYTKEEVRDLKEALILIYCDPKCESALKHITPTVKKLLYPTTL